MELQALLPMEVAMNVMYSSENYYVAEFLPGRHGIELVDKTSGRAGFLEGAVEVELTLYLQNGEQESRLLFVGPTAHAIHEAQRRCMIEDVTAVLARQFAKEPVAEVVAMVDRLFEQEWKERAIEEKKPERAFETATRPSRKHLH